MVSFNTTLIFVYVYVCTLCYVNKLLLFVVCFLFCFVFQTNVIAVAIVMVYVILAQIEFIVASCLTEK